METLEKEYGYDAVWISDTPEYLRCTVCQLVLRNPLQILACGHKFCSPCLRRLTDHTQGELQCPVDRNVVDMEKVCEDHGLRRAVSCLRVKCGNWEQGCVWEGELSDLEVHERGCAHQKPPSHASLSTQEVRDMLASLNVLRERMDKCEQEMQQKDKDNNHLKHALSELKEQHKTDIKSLKDEIHMLKDTSEREVNMLKEKNVILQKQIDELKEVTKVNAVEVKPAVVPYTRKVTLTRFKCRPNEVEFITEKQVKFKQAWGRPVCVVASDGGVPKGQKAYYEATLVEGKRFEGRVGWVNSKFLTSEESKCSRFLRE
jgi:hypothetical protein